MYHVRYVHSLMPTICKLMGTRLYMHGPMPGQVLGNALGLKHKHKRLTCGSSYLAVTIMTVIYFYVLLGCVKGIQHVRKKKKKKKNQIVLGKETF